MREVKRQKEKGKKAGGELCKRTPIPSCPERLLGCVKIRAIGVLNPCLSVFIRGFNTAFKIKKPSPNAQKLLKVNKGQLRLYDTPGRQQRLWRTGVNSRN